MQIPEAFARHICRPCPTPSTVCHYSEALETRPSPCLEVRHREDSPASHRRDMGMDGRIGRGGRMDITSRLGVVGIVGVEGLDDTGEGVMMIWGIRLG
jgi:hypothetical protein